MVNGCTVKELLVLDHRFETLRILFYKKNVWKRLEEVKVPFEMRAIGKRLCEKFISESKNNVGKY